MISKGRILYLLKYLYEYTDEEHTISTADITALYREKGFSASRNTVRDDLASLNDAGFEVFTERGNCNAYYMCSRPFERVEVRMLIDAVCSAQFICADKSHILIQKLAKLSDNCTPLTYTLPVHKTSNCQMYYHVNEIDLAIQEKKKIKFHYIEHTPDKQKILRHGGQFYSVSPYDLMWKEDRYYLLGWNDARDSVNTFRVDLMCDVSVTDKEAHEKPEEYALEHYGKYVSRMYEGEEQDVVLLCDNHLMTKILDKFGEDFESWVVDDEHFCAKVHTSVSKTFYGWLFQYVGEIELVGPNVIVQEYRQRALRCLEKSKEKNYGPRAE